MYYIQYKCSVTIILVAIIYSIHFILVNCIALILLSEILSFLYRASFQHME